MLKGIRLGSDLARRLGQETLTMLIYHLQSPHRSGWRSLPPQANPMYAGVIRKHIESARLSLPSSRMGSHLYGFIGNFGPNAPTPISQEWQTLDETLRLE
jgi:hypothetical protein